MRSKKHYFRPGESKRRGDRNATPGTRSDAGPRSLSIACELLQYLL